MCVANLGEGVLRKGDEETRKSPVGHAPFRFGKQKQLNFRREFLGEGDFMLSVALDAARAAHMDSW